MTQLLIKMYATFNLDRMMFVKGGTRLLGTSNDLGAAEHAEHQMDAWKI